MITLAASALINTLLVIGGPSLGKHVLSCSCSEADQITLGFSHVTVTKLVRSLSTSSVVLAGLWLLELLCVFADVKLLLFIGLGLSG